MSSPTPPPVTSPATPSPPTPTPVASPPTTTSTLPSGSPTPRTSPPASSGISTGTVVGIAIVGVAVIAATFMCFILFIYCCRKKRRIHDPEVPPDPPKVDLYYEQRHHNAPPSGDHDVVTMIKPPPPPPPFIISGLSTFTCEELAMATDWFSDGNLLGEGGFGYVHKGILSNGKEVAVKQLNVGSGQGEREFQTEVEILSRVHHKHLVSLIGYCITPTLLLVYDFLPNNTMDFHLHHAGKGMGMEFATRMRIALGSAKGLAYLHEDCYPKIIHRDIKAANILLDFNYEPKVADFGFAKIISDDDATNVSTTRVMGTFSYLAPEYLCSGKLSEKSDVFSFGVMLLELITGRRPNGLVNWARPLLTRALDDGNFDSIVDSRLQRNYNHNEMARMVSIADVCVRHSPRRRPKMSQVVRALEGHDMSLSDLDDDDSSIYNGSSDNDTQEYASSAPTSEYGSVSSSPIHTDGDEL